MDVQTLRPSAAASALRARPGARLEAMPRGLIVEDQPAVSRALAILFEVHDIPSEVVRTPDEAVGRLARGGIGLVIQDMNFAAGATSGQEGIDLFRRIRSADPSMPV